MSHDTGLTVRPVTRADAAVWLRLRTELWREDVEGEHQSAIQRYFDGTLAEPLAVLLAEDERDRPVGFVELSIRAYAQDCATDRVAYLEGWYVVSEARRQGVGRALIAAAEVWGRAEGCTEFASDTEVDDDRSASAHRAVGFRDAGLIRCFRKDL